MDGWVYTLEQGFNLYQVVQLRSSAGAFWFPKRSFDRVPLSSRAKRQPFLITLTIFAGFEDLYLRPDNSTFVRAHLI